MSMMSQSKKPMSTFCVIVALTLILRAQAAIAGESLPPFPVESSFLDQLDPDSYPSLPHPNKAVLVRWDFSDDHVYAYDFCQEVSAASEMDNMFGNEAAKITHQTMEGCGKLSLKSEGNNSARLVLEDFTVTMEIDTPGSDAPRTIESKAPPMIIQGVQEDGNMKLGNNRQEVLFRILFPIPPKPLKVGESVSVPAEMPFNAMGSLLHVKGRSNIKLVDHVQVNEKKCAKLETDIDISALNLPEELKGDYGFQVKGRSVFFFDIEDRHFVEGRLALLISMRVEAPTPKMNFPKEAEEVDIPDTVRMSMDSDNLLSVTFIDGKAKD